MSVFASVIGNPVCGDWVECDSNSNFAVKAALVAGDVDSGAKIATEINGLRRMMGQVLEVEAYPKDALELVKTPNRPLNNSANGALPGYLGQLDQVAGSATGGVSSKVHYAGAANLVVRINLITR